MTTRIREIVVIKIGSKVLVSELGKIRMEILRGLAKEISYLHEIGKAPIVVTSGAIACGNSFSMAKTIVDQQVAASVGQPKLMSHWSQAFDAYGMEISQILCTHRDFADKSSSVIEVLRRTLELRVIPIINDNDPVTNEEIRAWRDHGDNDALAAIIAVGIGANRLFLLSDVNGLCDGNPKVDQKLQPIPFIHVIDESVMQKAQHIDSDRPSGMASKIRAAKCATEAGVMVHIANGSRVNVLYDLMHDMPIGTTFLAQKQSAK